MDTFARFLFVRAIAVQFIVLIVVTKITTANETPNAEKLTMTDPRIPPQIAYFIPDRLFNDSILNKGFRFNGFSGKQPSVSNIWLPNHSPNRNSVTDLDTSQQHPYNYVAVKDNEKREFIEKDPAVDVQPINHQNDFGNTSQQQKRDKEPDFNHFERLQDVTESSAVKKVKPKKYIKRPISFNYANTLPNVRKRIKLLKANHENKFEITNDKQYASGRDVGFGDDFDTVTNAPKPERPKVYKIESKLKNSQYKRPQYSKLSQPMLHIENESSFNYDNGNLDENYNYPKHQHNKYCEHANPEMTDQLDNENEPENEDGDVDYFDSAKPQKGFAIYLTKVIKHQKSRPNLKLKSKPKPMPKLRPAYKSNKIRRIGERKKKSPKTEFVPTRMWSSVRRQTEVVHKPRKIQQPTMREKMVEKGGHVVYTEDGYEDSYYDHGKEDRSLEYLSRARARSRRSTNVRDLKGQKLIDHLDLLIRNVSDYLNSSEIIPDTDKKYPLYNSSDENIQDSPIKYSEYAKPVVDDEISSELYESKTKDCEEIEDNIDLSNAHNDTSGPKKRLGKLGDRLKCMKDKLFGNEPLDNPLFNEKNISQPKLDNIFSSIAQESEKLQTISSVYSDVMDNIKYNTFNENQRIFSDYGISDNFPLGTINTESAEIKPVNELNTNEKYPDQQRSDSKGQPKVTESPFVFVNPFQDPAQLPILDISKYIPTPRYPPTAEYPLQTDFVPVVARYASNYNKQVTVTTTTTNAPSKQTLPQYGPVRTLSPPYRKTPYLFVASKPHHIPNPNLQRTHAQNLMLVKNRRPLAMVRYVPNIPTAPRKS